MGTNSLRVGTTDAAITKAGSNEAKKHSCTVFIGFTMKCGDCRNYKK